MKVFVAGASGVIGKRLLPVLVESGHEVTAMTRTPGKSDDLRAAGADPVVCDVFDADALREAVVAARPEAVIHQLTNLPQDLDPRKKDVYDSTNRVRREGTDNLVTAALAAGVDRIVAQSFAPAYAPEGGMVKEEGDRLYLDAPPPFASGVESLVVLERAVTETPGIAGLALRFGFWYGPGTSYAPDGYTAEQVQKRRFPIVGSGDGTFSFCHIDDAAAATVVALERGGPGVYNVCDDEPAPVREWLPVYARQLGAKGPRRVPRWLARLFGGRLVAEMATGMRGASNDKAKRELGWEPRWVSWREGFREALG